MDKVSSIPIVSCDNGLPSSSKANSDIVLFQVNDSTDTHKDSPDVSKDNSTCSELPSGQIPSSVNALILVPEIETFDSQTIPLDQEVMITVNSIGELQSDENFKQRKAIAERAAIDNLKAMIGEFPRITTRSMSRSGSDGNIPHPHYSK